MGKKKKNVYDVDMNGIYKKDLITTLDFINNFLLKKYEKKVLIEKIREECDIKKEGIRNVIEYLETNNKNVFIIRREPDNKSKLWEHFTDYNTYVISAISVFD